MSDGGTTSRTRESEEAGRMYGSGGEMGFVLDCGMSKGRQPVVAGV